MHGGFFIRGKNWFEKLKKQKMALWLLEEGKISTLYEGKEKILLLQEKGPTQDAFTLKKRFPKPNSETFNLTTHTSLGAD